MRSERWFATAFLKGGVVLLGTRVHSAAEAPQGPSGPPAAPTELTACLPWRLAPEVGRPLSGSFVGADSAAVVAGVPALNGRMPVLG